MHIVKLNKMVMKAEDTLQAECVRWFRYQYPHIVIFAIPNGGQRNAITGALMKKTGTLAGVADLFVMKAQPDELFGLEYYYHGLFIEMKVGKGRQTESQTLFQQQAEKAGYRYIVCRTLDEFRYYVQQYIDG